MLPLRAPFAAAARSGLWAPAGRHIGAGGSGKELVKGERPMRHIVSVFARRSYFPSVGRRHSVS